MTTDETEPVDSGAHPPLAPAVARRAPRAGPLAALALLGVVTALLLVLLGWNIIAMHRAYGDLDERGLRVYREISRAAYADEALTLAANMAAQTGDSSWFARHAALEAEVLRDHASIADVAGRTGLRGDTVRLRQAQDSLLAHEHRAMTLAREGRLAEARAVMTSRGYEFHKQVYSRALGEVGNAFWARTEELKRLYQRRITWVQLLSGLSIVVLAIGFALALRNLRRYLALEQQDAERGARSQALLEARVRERTAVLEATSEQLRQAQKMEAIGQLAGGVAHDFNNLLTAIQGHAELLLSELEDAHPARADVEQIRKATERAAALTRQLLAFGRRQMLQPQVVSLNDIVRSTDRMLRRVLGAHIELVIVLDPELPHCRVDPNQLEQVLVNLLVNSRDAIGPGGGTITIETRTVGEEQSEGTRCVLVVRDTGSGMAPGVLGRIFEPFFTTKAVGKGTGLGLATVYGIVEQSGGEIRVESEPGVGTTFVVEFPACAAGTHSNEYPVIVPPAGAVAEAAVVLLVEDEPGVRHLLTRSLAARGFHVLVAQNGEEGCRVFARHADEINVVLSDVVMPLMGGPEMVQRLRETRPRLPVLFMSGYTASSASEYEVGGHTRFLAKPFAHAELIRILQALLAERDSGERRAITD